MPLISKTIPNLIGGVSQQPDALRLEGQFESLSNCRLSAVEGLNKRYPFDYLGDSGLDTSVGKPFVHIVDRGVTERYMLILPGNGTMTAWDLVANTTKSVTLNGASATYLTCSGDPREVFRVITTKDYSFVVNREVETALQSGGLSVSVGGGSVQVRETLTNVKHSVTVVWSATLGGGTTTTTVSYTALAADTTETVAVQLFNLLAAAIPALNLRLDGSVVYMTGNAGGGVYVTKIEASDGLGDLATVAAYDGGEVQLFSDLPKYSESGVRVNITGDTSSDADDYWVKFEGIGPRFYRGSWVESVAPDGTDYRLDATTMPYQIVRASDGTFTVDEIDWADRSAGDNESAPPPSFVGSVISDIFLFKNRLGVISDDHVVLSEVDNLFNFWPTSVATVLDSDRIDIKILDSKVVVLRHAVPYDEGVVLFSDRSQFLLRGNELLTPKTANSGVLTTHSCSRVIHPVVAGFSIFFGQPNGDFTTFREFMVADNDVGFMAPEIALQVPVYIPGDTTHLEASDSTGHLIAFNGSSSVYVYNWLYAGDRRVLSAWHKWTFAGDVVGGGFVENDLYVLQGTPDGDYHILKASLGDSRVDTGAEFNIHLDGRHTPPSLIYDSGTDTTTITLGYSVTSDEDLEIVVDHNNSGDLKTGQILNEAGTRASNALLVSGDITGNDLVVGRPYTMQATFGTIHLTRSENNQSIPVLEGRLQLRSATLSYADTGYFEVHTDLQLRDRVTKIFSGRVLNSVNNILGQVSLEDGEFRFPILSVNDRATIVLENPTFLPSRFLTMEWEGFYHRRNRGV